MAGIKGENGENILIEVIKRKYPDSIDVIDKDFLEATLKSYTSGFTAKFNFITRASEIEYFISNLKKLSSQEVMNLQFNTIEDSLFFNLKITGLGKIEWEIELIYPSVKRTKMIVYLENGISSIDLLIIELETMLQEIR